MAQGHPSHPIDSGLFSAPFFLLTCFHASFFPFCPVCWPPLVLSFSRTFSPFPHPRKVLCSVEQRAQHTAWRGAVSGWTSPKSSGRKFLPEICVKKGQRYAPLMSRRTQLWGTMFAVFWALSVANPLLEASDDFSHSKPREPRDQNLKTTPF